MSNGILAVLASLALLVSPQARAEGPATGADSECSGDVSGAVVANFNCTVKVAKAAGGTMTFTVTPNAPVKGLKSFAPATFSIKLPITVQTYTHRDLAKAEAQAVTAAGKKYHASGKVADRGDIEVEVVSTEHNRGITIGMLRVHAHLVPANAKDGSEIQLNMNVLTNW